MASSNAASADLAEQSERIEAMLAPVSEEEPCGADATYDDDFQLVKGKIDDLSSFSGSIDQEKALSGGDESFVQHDDDDDSGGGPFAVIEAASRRILREKSKDVRIACYLCLALAHQRGLVRGTAEGLGVLRALVETYWEEMHPPLRRMRARGGALTFLFQRLSDRFDEADGDALTADDRAPLERALSDLAALQSDLMEKMEDEAPLTSTLKKRMEALLRQVPDPPAGDGEDSAEDTQGENVAEGNSTGAGAASGEPASNGAAPEESAEDAAGAEAQAGDSTTTTSAEAPPRQQRNGETPASSRPQPAAEGGAPPGENGVAAPEDLSAQQANQRLLRLAAALRAEDDTQAAPYRIVRALRWDALRDLPPHDAADQQTRVAPPPKQRRAYLSGLPEKEDYARLVNDAEESFRQSPFHFWLDLQRLLARGLDALGAPYEAAAQAVRRECALLVERLPALPELSFRDGTPFANAATREWIETSARPALGTSGGDEAGSGGGHALDEQFQEARRRLADGDLADALQHMNENGEAPSRAAPSGQERFRRRLYRALLCTRAGRPDVARPALQALCDEADRRDLSTWDPPLALEAWAGLYECLTAQAREERASQNRQTAPQSQQGPQEAEDDLDVRITQAFDHVCEINPERALEIRQDAASE